MQKARERVSAMLLLGLAGGATLAIWSSDPFLEWGYEAASFLLAGWTVLWLNRSLRCAPMLALAVLLALWGLAQWAAGATVDRYATLNAALRVGALASTALVASEAFARAEARERLLRWFSWFGFLLAVISLTAYYGSPGKILWLFASPYPDVWGPFLSRNNFAQFLELALPAALWLACTGRGPVYFWMSAVMLACGLASASRAGAVLLVLETGVVFLRANSKRSRRMIPVFALATLVFASLAGAGFLIERFSDSDPLRVRREIYQASVTMIGARPWAGYGLGTFATVYPEFARFDPGAAVEHAHSDWIEWAVEGGWLYASAWMLLALVASRSALRSVWGIGVPAVFAHALVDYPLARFGVSAWVFVLAGALGWSAGGARVGTERR